MESIAFNLGFLVKYILGPYFMLFHPVKVPLKVFSILFKFLTTYCVVALALLEPQTYSNKSTVHVSSKTKYDTFPALPHYWSHPLVSSNCKTALACLSLAQMSNSVLGTNVTRQI